uniref:Putative secreted protein n=1 Tax=Ixodes ricinus TaxID=34613 RepID=A0A147BP23_IXORI
MTLGICTLIRITSAVCAFIYFFSKETFSCQRIFLSFLFSSTPCLFAQGLLRFSKTALWFAVAESATRQSPIWKNLKGNVMVFVFLLCVCKSPLNQ